MSLNSISAVYEGTGCEIMGRHQIRAKGLGQETSSPRAFGQGSQAFQMFTPLNGLNSEVEVAPTSGRLCIIRIPPVGDDGAATTPIVS